MAKTRSTKAKGANSIADLRPLLESLNPHQGDTYIPAVKRRGRSRAVCVSCGAEDKQIMIRKHRKGCLYKAFYAALDILRERLGLSSEVSNG